MTWKLLCQERPPLFSGILQNDYARISAGARPREFARGEILYCEGSSAKQVLLVTAGLVKITKLGVSGTEVILRLGGPGDVLGACSPFIAGLHGTTAQAFRPCRTMMWEALHFHSLVEPYPVLKQNLASILNGHLLELEDRFREIATERVAPRVARQLVRLAEQIGHLVDGAIEIGLSREELAQMTGTTLFTVSRVFSSWEARGILRPRREAVSICDMQALCALSQEN